METNHTPLSFIINNEPRIKNAKLSILLPLMRLQALSTKDKVNTSKGFKNVLRALNRSIILN